MQEGSTCLHKAAYLGNLSKVQVAIEGGGAELMLKKRKVGTSAWQQFVARIGYV